MIEQQFVELRTRHLVGAIALRAETVLEIKLRALGSAGGGDFAAVLRHECGIEFLAHPKTIECSHAEWQERFANVEARKLFTLENNHAPTGLGEQRRSRAAGRTAANDRDVVEISVFHSPISLAKFPDFGRDAALRRPRTSQRDVPTVLC